MFSPANLSKSMVYHSYIAKYKIGKVKLFNEVEPVHLKVCFSSLFCFLVMTFIYCVFMFFNKRTSEAKKIIAIIFNISHYFY